MAAQQEASGRKLAATLCLTVVTSVRAQMCGFIVLEVGPAVARGHNLVRRVASGWQCFG